MKQILHIILIVFCISSCSLLEENPVTSLTEKDVYTTEDALEKNINGILLSFQGDMMFQGNMLEALQSASGLTHWGTSSFLNDERWACILRTFTFSPGTTYNINMYNSLYSVINRCNKLIDALPSSPVDQAYKDEIEAEAKFYRAVIYFCLVRLYGDVPLVVRHAENESDTANPRVHYCKIYQQIVSDFTDAWEGMRSPERVMLTTGTQGHPNKWAAKSFLAATYLSVASILHVPENENFYDNSRPERKPDFSAIGIDDEDDAWQLALDAATEVISQGPYKLASHYQDLFRWESGYTDKYGKDCWNLDERIFVLQSTGANQRDYTAVRTLPKYPEGVTVTSPASTSGRIRPTRFLFQKWCEMTDGHLGPEGTDSQDIYVSTDDPRLDISLIHTRYISSETKETKYIYVYPWYVNIYNTSQSSVMPYYKKYLTPTFMGKPDVADFYFMRFSELFYIAAEASARLGHIKDAYNYIECVHKRARQSTADGTESSAPAWYVGKFQNEDELVNAIIWDKLFEFCGEGHEFYEVRRYGARWMKEQIISPINEFLQDPRQDKSLRRGNYYGEGFQYPSDIQKLRASILCEFPSVELSMNPALTNDNHNDFTWE